MEAGGNSAETPLLGTSRRGAASSIQTLGNIVVSILGTGVLGLPFAFRMAGWLAGTVGVIVAGLSTLYCMLILVRNIHVLLGLSFCSVVNWLHRSNLFCMISGAMQETVGVRGREDVWRFRVRMYGKSRPCSDGVADFRILLRWLGGVSQVYWADTGITVQWVGV